jgi:hypothetical protein
MLDMTIPRSISTCRGDYDDGDNRNGNNADQPEREFSRLGTG